MDFPLARAAAIRALWVMDFEPGTETVALIFQLAVFLS